MKKLIAILILIGLGFLVVKYTKPHIETNNPLNISYEIKGERIELKNGKAERAILPGSASKQVISVFGEPVYGDLDKDGDEDAVMYITEDNGGSGTFFYVVVALNEQGKFQGTDAMFLGDRIAPQNINIIDGRAVANFADRRADESFSTPPSVAKSVWVHINGREIGEWVKDFEGENI